MTDVSTQTGRLLAARTGGPLALDAAEPATRDLVWAVQEETVAALGGIGGWKVGASSTTAAPTCAPLPARGILRSDSLWVSGAPWVAVEVEIAFRVARPIDADLAGRLDERPIVEACFDAVMVAVEIVETRLGGWESASPLAEETDLPSHGALIVGPQRPLSGPKLGFASVAARLEIEGADPTTTFRGNPAGDPRRRLRPLALHWVDRGLPLQPRQIVTTGSFTGMTNVLPPTNFVGKISGFDDVRGHILVGQSPSIPNERHAGATVCE